MLEKWCWNNWVSIFSKKIKNGLNHRTYTLQKNGFQMHCVDPNAKYEWGKRKCGSGFLDESLDTTGKTYEKNG